MKVSVSLTPAKSDGPSSLDLGAEEEPVLDDALPVPDDALPVPDDALTVLDDTIEVIDVENYKPMYCSCSSRDTSTVLPRPTRVVFAIPAIRVRCGIDSLPSFEVLDAARHKLRLYFAQRYKILQERDLLARAFARKSPRRSPRHH